MGYYIEGPTRGKTAFLINMHGAVEVTVERAAEVFENSEEEHGVICVINGTFEAAGFCYDEDEFEEFADPYDRRPKRWLLLPRHTAEKLSGFKRSKADDE